MLVLGAEPGWSGTCFVEEAGLELSDICLPLPGECRLTVSLYRVQPCLLFFKLTYKFVGFTVEVLHVSYT